LQLLHAGGDVDRWFAGAQLPANDFAKGLPGEARVARGHAPNIESQHR
jgi:hypothetical protein